MRSFRPVLALALVALAVPGCLEKPSIEQRWTRVDITSANVKTGDVLTAGVTDSLHVATTITYRRIVTGYAVAELRASATLTPASAAIQPLAPRVPMANDIDVILQQSVSLGRAVRAVTGWDHLIQPVTFDFRAVPQMAVDSSGVSLGATSGVFLICYLGSGVRIERPGQADSIAVTPFLSTPNQILPVGMTLGVQP